MHLISFDIEKNRFYIEYEGDVTFSTMKEVFAELVVHPNFRKSMDMLFDLKFIGRLGSVTEAIDFGKFQDGIVEQRGFDFKSAIVCRQEEFFSQMCVLADYAKSSDAESIVFRSREEAIEWLDESGLDDISLEGMEKIV